MKVCLGNNSILHGEIVHDAEECPLCAEIDRVLELQDKIVELENTIEDLKETVEMYAENQRNRKAGY